MQTNCRSNMRSLSILNEVAECGYCFVPELDPTGDEHEVLSRLGQMITLGSESPVHYLRPKNANDSTPNTYSDNYGFGQFPFHTDLANWYRPPRYIALRCITGFDEVSTPLIDAQSIITAIGASNLFRCVVQPRRPVEGILARLRLYEKIDSTELFRWDSRFIVATNPHAASAMKMIQEMLTSEPKHLTTLARPGDTLIIDNWRMLHGREEVPPQCSGRTIARVYLESIA